MLKASPVASLLLIALLLPACGGSGDSGPTVDPDGPRAAYEAYRAAIQGGDFDALKALLAEEAREKVSAVDSKTVMGMLKAFTPSRAKVEGMEVDGDVATIRLSDPGDEQARGTVRMIREDGAWKVEKEGWNLGGGDGGGESEPEIDPATIPDREPDGDWRLDCHQLEVGDSPAAGRMGGAPFTVRYAQIENGILTLTDGGKFKWTGSFTIFLFFHGEGADESLPGKTISIGPEKDWDAKVGAHIHFGRQPEGEDMEMDVSTDGFALRLEFGEEQDGKLPGRIHLSYPDEKKSFVVGSFTALLE